MDIISPDIEYLVGVSGGRDSMVLLNWLTALGFENLIICHFNHSLRGDDSDGDEKFVNETANDLGVECISVKNDSRVFAKQSKQSLETAARESRYRFFARIAKEKSCQRVILAHHADDQVETVVMNLFRGTGLKGLGGMNPVSHREVDGFPLEVIRPFLSVRRSEIDAYCEKNEIEFRDDVTNQETFATRNRVRLELLPLAEEIFQREPSKSILRVSEIARMEQAASLLRARRWLGQHLSEWGSLPVKSLRQLPPADLSRVLRLWLQNRDIPNVGFDVIQKVITMIRSKDKPAKVNLPGDNFARRRSGSIFLSDE